MSKNYYIESLGCAKNLVDSEAFAFIFDSFGWESCYDPGDADVILVNSCAFLAESQEELYDVLDDFEDSLDEDGETRVWVTGCITKRGLEEFQDDFPFVEHWIDLKDFEGFRKLLLSEEKATTGEGVDNTTPAFPQPRRMQLSSTGYAYLRISDGCSNHCSYCTIPQIRGEMKSLPIEDLVAEAKAMVQDRNRWVNELIIIAQDTASYGVDLYGRQALPELLEALHEIKEIKWFRLLYLHPDHFQLQWLELWKRLPRLLPYFEIPIQHCCDHILKAMGRKKGETELREMFHAIKKAIPHAVLRTTLILGFPGETDNDYQRLKSFVKDIRFQHLGTFSYSPEEGTPAYMMPNQLSEKTAMKRRQHIANFHARISEAYLQSYIGKELEVMIDVDDGDIFLTDYENEGHPWFLAPDDDGKFYIEDRFLVPGKFYRVRVLDSDGYNLYGRAILDREEL